MAWRRYADLVDRPSYFEPELIQPPFQRKIYACTYPTDSDKLCRTPLHVRFDGKRNHSFQKSLCLSANFRWDCTGKTASCAFGILGLCADGPTSWPALEYDFQHGAQSCRVGCIIQPIFLRYRVSHDVISVFHLRLRSLVDISTFSTASNHCSCRYKGVLYTQVLSFLAVFSS